MGKFRSVAVAGIVLALVAAGCNRGDDEAVTTTTLPPRTPTTAEPPAGDVPADDQPGTAAGPATTTTEPGVELQVPRYEIVRRSPGEAGDTVVVLLDTASYDALTDIDLQNVVADVVERFPPILEAFVVDSPDAVDLVLKDERTEDEETSLAEHHFVRLEDGFRMVFVGPFSSVGELILGS